MSLPGNRTEGRCSARPTLLLVAGMTRGLTAGSVLLCCALPLGNTSDHA